MASVRKRVRKDGTPSWQVMWRDNDGTQSSVTFLTEPEAYSLRNALKANGGNYSKAEQVIAPAPGVRTVTDMAEEHINLLLRPTPHTIANYHGYLSNHINDSIGAVPVDQLTRQQVTSWVRGLLKKRTAPGRTMSPKTIKNVYAFLSSVMSRSVQLEYRPSNPCVGVELPVSRGVEDETMFLTFEEFTLIRDHMDERYKTFISLLVMTGARFGEATALTVGDVNVAARPATLRINKAWKEDGHNRWYVGPPKTPGSKRTIAIPSTLVDLLKPLMAGRPSTELLFVEPSGGRIDHHKFYPQYWKRAVKAAQDADKTFVKTPKPHGLRHTHASWLIQEGVEMFKVARRLGHSNTALLDQIYAHLMPDAQIESVTAIGRAMLGDGESLKEIAG